MDWDLSSQGPADISRDDNSFLYAGSGGALPEGGPEVGVDGVAGPVGAVEPHVEVGLVVPGLVLDAVGRGLEWIITEYNDDRSGVRANNPLIVFAVSSLSGDHHLVTKIVPAAHPALHDWSTGWLWQQKPGTRELVAVAQLLLFYINYKDSIYWEASGPGLYCWPVRRVFAKWRGGEGRNC